MKSLISILLLCMVAILSNCKPSQEVVSKSEYMALQDSIQLYNVKITSLAAEKEKMKDSTEVIRQDQERTLRCLRTLKDSVVMMQDSIENLLIRPMMTNDHFVMIYKYLSIKKYFLICEKNPTQYKYFKGWVIQVIQEK